MSKAETQWGIYNEISPVKVVLVKGANNLPYMYGEEVNDLWHEELIRGVTAEKTALVVAEKRYFHQRKNKVNNKERN